MKKLTLLEKFVLVTTSLIIVAFAYGVGAYLLSARSKYEYMSRTEVYVETYRGYDIYATYNSQEFGGSLTGYYFTINLGAQHIWGRNSAGIVTDSFLTVQEVKNCIDTTPRIEVYIETYRGYDIYATYNSDGGFLTGYFGRNSTGIGIVTASFLTVQEVKNCIDTTP